MKIYTKTGDNGETSLFGGERVPKYHDRIEAYGTIDELNSVIGLAIAETLDSSIHNLLRIIQQDLFSLGADLATPADKRERVEIPKIEQSHYKNLENKIDVYSDKLPELKHFILPGGSKGASLLNVARTVCRRAERIVVAASEEFDISPNIVIYLNRLSDLLFVLARYENFMNGIEEDKWIYKRG